MKKKNHAKNFFIKLYSANIVMSNDLRHAIFQEKKKYSFSFFLFERVNDILWNKNFYVVDMLEGLLTN